MKKLSIFIAALILVCASSYSQSPQMMSYQAVIRNASNNLIVSAPIGMQITIQQGTPGGTNVYQETHTPTTNINGLVSIEIGNGTPVSGTFSAIDWSAGPYYVLVETDPMGGSSYTVSATTQFLSVPYALYAASAGVSGTTNYVSKFAGTGTTLDTSQIFDDGYNVGIGSNMPSYKLDVNHGGSTGIRSKSTSSFSVVDIDAFSGDAALRFAHDGVNQWNVRNRPADDYLEFFELGGGGSRMVIQDGTGNVGVGETTSPSYRLDVLHGGATGIRSRSSSTFSLMDIDASNGDAALRFAKAGVNQWNTRNNPATDDYQIFELGGGGERMRIDNTTGKVWVNGDFTCLGVKAFTMDHPLDPENKLLVHAAIESNEVLNVYSGNVTTDANGNAIVTLPDYFSAINKDFRYQLTVVGVFAQAIIGKEISGNQFEILTNQPNVKVSWEVTGVRNDAHMQMFPFADVQNKSGHYQGKYVDPIVHKQPESRGVSYDPNMNSSLYHVAPSEKTTKQINNEGTSVDK